jgi:hypothetical protein
MSNAMEFGFVNDGNTPNDAAWQRMLAAPAGGSLMFPRGTYYFADDIRLTRAMRIAGEGAEGSRLRFAALKGLIVEGAEGAVIEKLAFDAVERSIDKRKAGALYHVGDLVHLPGEYRWYYECVGGGTSGPELAPELAADLGATVGDGGVSWLCRSAAGIRVRARARVRDCYFSSFWGPAIHIQAKDWGVENVRVTHCGAVVAH